MDDNEMENFTGQPKSHSDNNVKEELKDEITCDDNNKTLRNGGLQLANDNCQTKSESNEEEKKDLKLDSPKSEEASDDSVQITRISVLLLHQEPKYAELCGFFNLFSSLLSIKPVSFTKIEKMFCTFYDGEVDQELIDLHVTLMRKIYLKFARAEKWESALQKFCSTCPALEAEAVQLARRGYANLELPMRLTILKALCETQFDFNVKFKENIFNTYQTNELRLAPIGSDKNGLSYFYQQDCELNIRIYTVEPDDMSESTWALKAKSGDELLELIAELKNPDFGKKLDSKENDDDIDEEKLLDEKVTDTKLNTLTEKAREKSLPKPELSEAEQNAIVMLTKRAALWNFFHDSTIINKKKITKEEKKKEKGIFKDVPASEKVIPDEVEGDANVGAVKSSDENELDEEIIVAIEEEDRRIMPRRNAKINAITNLKALGALPKKTAAKTSPPKKSGTNVKEKTKLPSFVETLPNSSDEFDSDEDEEDEEDDVNSSDDEDFTLGKQKVEKADGSNSNNKTAAKKKREQIQRRATGRPPTNLLAIRGARPTKQPEITFTSSSDEEDDSQTEAEQQKERKKATEKTLCMNCRSSKRPDLLLLCDMCDDAWHTWCLRPQLWYVPDGDWFCPKCQHAMLIQKLSYAWIKLSDAIKNKQSEDKKKQAAADRLKREMEYIGISLNNIIPNNRGPKIADNPSSSQSESDVEEDENNRMRKSKRRAMKRVLGGKTRRKVEPKYYGPIVTIAEGRSRRATTKVDYNFQAYDEQLQEALEEEPMEEDEPPTSGLGRGKDMATIYEAERKRKAKEEPLITDGGETSNMERLADANPPTKQANRPAKKRPRLTDLNVDPMSESSDADEYKEEEDAAVSEEPEPSEDEYLPREFQRTRRSRRGGLTKSDEEFINDDDSSSEYEISARKRNAQKRGNRRAGKRAKRGKRYSDSEEEEGSFNNSEDFCSNSSDDDAAARRGRHRGASVRASKWQPPASTSDEDEEELEVPSESSNDERTETGRPLRRAAVVTQRKVRAIDEELENVDDEEEEDDEDAEENDKEADVVGVEEAAGDAVEVEKRAAARGRPPTSALTQRKRERRRKRVSLTDGEPDFQPDNDEEEDEESEEVEEEMAFDKDKNEPTEDEGRNEKIKERQGEKKTNAKSPAAKIGVVESVEKEASTMNGVKEVAEKRSAFIRKGRGKAKLPTPPPELSKGRTRGEEKSLESKATETKSTDSAAAVAAADFATRTTTTSSTASLTSITTLPPPPTTTTTTISASGTTVKISATTSQALSHATAKPIVAYSGAPPHSTAASFQFSSVGSLSSAVPETSVYQTMALTSVVSIAGDPPAGVHAIGQQPLSHIPAHIFHQLGRSPPQHPPPPALTGLLPPQSVYGAVPSHGVFYTMPQAGKMPAPPHAFIHHPPPPEFYAQYTQLPPPPQFIYQPMQPFPPTMPPLSSADQQPQPMSVDPRTGFVDSDSLGHALAGAMNPEDL